MKRVRIRVTCRNLGRFCVGVAAGAVACAASAFADGTAYHLKASDDPGWSSYNNEKQNNWVDEAGVAATGAPKAGCTYLVADGLSLRTPVKGDTDELPFGGDALTFGTSGTDKTEGKFVLKTYYSCYPKIGNLILVNGEISTSWNDKNVPGGFKGVAHVRATAKCPFKLSTENGRTLRVFADLEGARGTALELKQTSGAVGALAVGGDNSNWYGQMIAREGHPLTFVKPASAALETTFGGDAGADVADAWLLGGGTKVVLDGFGSVKASRRGITVEASGAELNVASGKAALYDGQLAGPGELRRTGAGTLTLDGAWTAAKVALAEGSTVLGANLAADETSSLQVGAGATLTWTAAGATFGGELACAAKARLVVPVDAEGAAPRALTVGQGLTLEGPLTIAFAARPNESAGVLTLLRIPSESRLTANDFALGDNRGAYTRLVVETADGVSAVRAVADGAVQYHLSANDGFNESSFASIGHWVDANGAAATAEPNAGADYLVTNGLKLRTSAEWKSSRTFGGAQLILGDATSSGLLLLKNTGKVSATVPRLVAVSGSIQAAGNQMATEAIEQRLGGTIQVQSVESNPFAFEIGGPNRTIAFDGALVGDATNALCLTAGVDTVADGFGRLVLAGTNASWKGSLSVKDACLELVLATAAAFGGAAEAAKPAAWRFLSSEAADGPMSGSLVFGPGFTNSVAATGRGITFDGFGALVAEAGTNVVYDGSLTAPMGVRKTGAGSVTLAGVVSGSLEVAAGELALADKAVAPSSLDIKAGATLSVTAGGCAPQADVTFADGAELRLVNSAEGAVPSLVTTGRVMVEDQGRVRVSLTALPQDLGGTDGVAILSCDAASGLSADRFELGTVAGLPLSESLVVVTSGSVATLKLVFRSAARGLQPVSYTEEPTHWTTGAKAYDADTDYLVVGGSWRQGAEKGRWTVDYTGRSYTILGSPSALADTRAGQCYFQPTHVTNRVNRLAFYGSAGIVAGGTQVGWPQRLYGLSAESRIDIANVGEQAFFVDPDGNFLYVNVPFSGTGRLQVGTTASVGGSVCLRSDNTEWCGPTEIVGQKGYGFVTLFIQDENQLGAAPAAFDARFLTVRAKGVLGVEDGQKVTLDDETRGVTLAEGAGLETRAGSVLTLATPVVLGGRVTKKGTGRLTLAAATTGSGTLSVTNGELSVVHGRACVDGSVAFAKEASLVISAAEGVEENLAAYGLLNLKADGVTATEGLTIRLDVLMARTTGVRPEVPLLTVSKACAEKLSGKIALTRIGRGVLVALAQRDITVDGVEATQFYATCNSPLLMMIR